MVLYDVILAGFPAGPKIGNSEAEALSTVFGIPRQVAERMVDKVPAVVKSGVTEEVCRKYYNAFAYIGARCTFLVTGEHNVRQDEAGDEFARPTTVSEEPPSPLPLSPTSPQEVVSPTPDTGTLARQVRAARLSASTSQPVPQPIRQVSDSGATRRSPSVSQPALAEDDGNAASSERKRRAEANAGSAPIVRVEKRIRPPHAETVNSLPHRHLRAILREHQDSSDVLLYGSGNGPQLLAPDNEAFDRALYGSLSVEMTPPEIKGWPPVGSVTEQTQSRTVSKSGWVEPQSAPMEVPPEASTLDANPAIDGARPDQEDSLGEDDRLTLDSGSWPSDSGLVPAGFLRMSDRTGDISASAGTQLRFEPHIGMTAGPVSGPHDGPSVAEIKAAWKAGKDIALGPSLPERDEPPSLDDWAPWIGSELADADFPSGVAVDESRENNANAVGQRTQLEAPANSRLMAQLEAPKRATLQLDDNLTVGPRPTSDDAAARASAPTDANSDAPLFGAPLGARTLSESETVAGVPNERQDDEQPPRCRTTGRSGRPTEVPAAAINFVRTQKRK